jgi:hypothetical protein
MVVNASRWSAAAWYTDAESGRIASIVSRRSRLGSESMGRATDRQIDGLLVPIPQSTAPRNLCDRAIDDAHVAILLDVIGKRAGRRARIICVARLACVRPAVVIVASGSMRLLHRR